MEQDLISYGKIEKNSRLTEVDTLMPTLAFVIPTFNHILDGQLTEIGTLFAECPHSIITINDGSLGTILNISDPNITLIKHESNIGLAQSLVDGYRKALETSAKVIIRTDADGEYPISTVSKAISILQDGKNAGVFVA